MLFGKALTQKAGNLSEFVRESKKRNKDELEEKCKGSRRKGSEIVGG